MGRGRQSVGVLVSEASRQAYVETARKAGEVYRFRGAAGMRRWITGQAAYLAPKALSDNN